MRAADVDVLQENEVTDTSESKYIPYISEIQFDQDTDSVKAGTVLTGQITVQNSSKEDIKIAEQGAIIDWEKDGESYYKEYGFLVLENGSVQIPSGKSGTLKFKVDVTRFAAGGQRIINSVSIETSTGAIGIQKDEDGKFEFCYWGQEDTKILDSSLINEDLTNLSYTVAENPDADNIKMEVSKITIDNSKSYFPGSRIPVMVYVSNDDSKLAKLKTVYISFFREDSQNEEELDLVDTTTEEIIRVSNGVYMFYVDINNSVRDGVYRLNQVELIDEADNWETEYAESFDKMCYFTIGREIKVSGISLNAVSNKIAAGKKASVTAAVSPANATNKALTWTSSNTKYATVDASGKVSFKKAGAGKNVTITATAADGSGKSASIKFSIKKDAVKSIKLKAAKTVKAGKSIKVKATVKTTGKKVNKKLKWTSGNPAYATVNGSGKVKTYKAGKGRKVKITAMATDGSNKKKSVTIKIK